MTTLRHEALARPRSTGPATIANYAVLVVTVGIAWSVMVGQAHTMSSMVQGLAQVGRAVTFDMSTAAFIGMWATMMTAMMLPVVAPLVLDYARWRAPVAGMTARVVFAAGYLVVWVVTGVFALVALRTMSGGHASASLDRLGGAVLLVAGAYQFAPSKRRATAAYRRLLGAPATLSPTGGPVSAAREGVQLGVCCLACCGALMAVLVAVGVMSLAWLAALTTVCFAERNWRHGSAVTSVTGFVLLSLGLAVLLHPHFLTALAPSPAAMGPMMN